MEKPGHDGPGSGENKDTSVNSELSKSTPAPLEKQPPEDWVGSEFGLPPLEDGAADE